MAYVLATTETIVRWYYFDSINIQPGVFTLRVELNLSLIIQHADKSSARNAAKALGLKTWRYVRLP